MFYYINQPLTPSFPIGLVKTKSEALDQLRLTYDMKFGVSYDNIDVYHFLAFSDLTCYLEKIQQ